MIKGVVAAAVLAPVAAKVYFEDKFETGISDRWVGSTWKGESMGEWKWTAGEWYGDKEAAMGMQVTENMRFHTISAKMDAEANTVSDKLVIQFSVKHEKKDYAFCGGGYIKLLGGDLDQTEFGGDTQYAIMFGPDLCGYDVSRVHVIFEHEGENLVKEDEIKMDYADKDEYTHLHTLVVNLDGTYEVFLDQVPKASGSIEKHWAFPRAEMDDPAVSKPVDWVETKKIVDPAASKPDGWDDIPPEIPDPDAETPEDWDVEEDGEWEPPMMANPAYKGAWKAPMIDNPDYKGDWVHPKVPNPAYKPETYAKFAGLHTVGFELWTVNAGSIFDNVLITDDLEYAAAAADRDWKPNHDLEKEAKEAWKKTTMSEDEEDEEDDEDEEDEAEEQVKDEL